MYGPHFVLGVSVNVSLLRKPAGPLQVWWGSTLVTASPRFDVAVSLHRITGPYSGDDLWLTERRQLAHLSSILGLWFIKASLMFQVIIYNVLRALRYEK